MNRPFLGFFLLVFAIAVALTGCDLFAPVDADAVKAAAGGYIHGFVRDQDGAPLGGVTVTYSNPDARGSDEENATESQTSTIVATETVLTDSSGFFQINELVTGTYRLTFTLDGYTLDTTTVQIEGDGYLYLVDDESEGSSSMGWKYTDQVLVTLYAKTATATGTITMEKGASVLPAAGKTVVAVFDGRFFSEVQTNASGVYSFTGLPAGPVAFYARSFYDGALFYPDLLLTFWYDASDNKVLAATDLSARAKSIDPAVWQPTDGTTPFVASSNLSSSFPVGSNITLAFNKPIASGAFTLTRGEGEGVVDLNFVASWSSDGRTVTLDPVETLRTGTTYYIGFTVTATDGYSGTTLASLSFTTEEGIKFVSSNALDLDGTPTRSFNPGADITLTFSRSVARYNVADIELRDTVGTAGNTLAVDVTSSSTTVTISPQLDLANDKEYVISWTVYSSLNSGTDSDSGSITFKTVKSELTAPAAVTGFTLDPGDFEADWDTTTVPFIFNRVTGADGYVIYATDTINGVEKYVVGEVEDPGPIVYASTLGGEADLSNFIFDTWPDNGVDPEVQPFAHGNQISFTIRAYVANEDERLFGAENATPVTLDDTIPPEVETEGTHINLPAAFPYTAATTEIVTLRFVMNEALDRTQPATGVTSQTWAADPNRPAASRSSFDSQEVVIRVTLDAGDTITSGDSFIFQFRDTSGNTGTHQYTFQE